MQKLKDIQMFNKWEHMPFNFKKTYLYILSLIYMSLNS